MHRNFEGEITISLAEYAELTGSQAENQRLKNELEFVTHNFNQAEGHIDNINLETQRLKEQLAAAKGLFERWLMNEINHVFQNTTLQADTKAFLTPPPAAESTQEGSK